MFAVAIATAIWLGIQTSISPCPLATNIAAISFIAKKVGSTRQVLLSGLLYTLGRTIVYLGIGIIVTTGLLANWQISPFLQKYASKLLGPVLILVGMILLGLINVSFSRSAGGMGLQKRTEKGGTWWAGILGIVFALSFCPISAGLFFGGLIPLSVRQGSRVLLPSLFGVGTALPVIVFAFIIAFAAQHVGKAFDRLTQIERWARRITGAVFIAAGVHFCLSSIFSLY